MLADPDEDNVSVGEDYIEIDPNESADVGEVHSEDMEDKHRRTIDNVREPVEHKRSMKPSLSTEALEEEKSGESSESIESSSHQSSLSETGYAFA